MPQPTKIPRPFADSGDKNSIPDSSGSIGFASWQEGFPAITSEPFAQGGVAPKRADFNGIFYALSRATLWQQQGGFYAYDATTDYEVGNIVLYSGDLYKCTTANGPNSAVKAPTDTTAWAKVILTTATMSAAGYMSAADKTNLDKLLAYDTASTAATPDLATLMSGASFEYRNLGALTILSGNGKFLTATTRYGGRRVATGVPAVAWNAQPKAYFYSDSNTYYGAWVTVDVNGYVYVNTRDVAIPANSLFYVNIMYPRAL